MSDISEKDWKSALTSILEELDTQQYSKLLQCLSKIPKSQKTGKSRPKMSQKIIECYGLDESISAINDAIEEIPRRDADVQDLLRPFVTKLSNKPEKENRGKRKCDPVEEDKRPAAGKKRKRDPLEERRPAADQQKSRPPDKERNTHPTWKKSVSDLKSSSELRNIDGITVKVVQKSGLCTYQTKDQVKKFFFYVAVADKTASMKLMVYGKERYQKIKEEKCYLFRRLIKDDVSVKVTTQSVMSETKSVEVPEELEMEARKLIYPKSPVCSIAEAKSCVDGTKTVVGTVTEIDPIGKVTVQDERKKIKRQNFQLKDDTGSVRICMWRKDTEQSKRLSAGDVVKVTNLKTNKYHESVSLNSTGSTRILEVQSVGIQNVTLQIEGIIKVTERETHLDADINQQLQVFVVASPLLAEAFGLKLDGNLIESLLDEIPLSAEAVIQGNKIKKITAASKM